MVNSPNNSPEELLRVVQQIKVIALFHTMRKRVAENGCIEDSSINAEISTA